MRAADADRALGAWPPLGKSQVRRIFLVVSWYRFGKWTVTARKVACPSVVTVNREPPEVALIVRASSGAATDTAL